MWPSFCNVGAIGPDGITDRQAYTTFSFGDLSSDYQTCLNDLSCNVGVTIIGCSIRQARRFPETLRQALIGPVFDVVIIDESSQVPVSHALSAFCSLKEDARLIISGDHLQMPPITSVEAPADADYLVGSIQTYLRQRRFANQLVECTLQTNYRSNEHIVAFARRIGYPSSLEAHFRDSSLHSMGAAPQRVNYPNNLPWCDNFECVLNEDNKVLSILHEDDISSQANRYEAQIVAGVIWMLRQTVSAELDGRGLVSHSTPTSSQFWQKCVGIVTPHRAQRALIIQELENLFPGELNDINDAVDTVERFQGGERHTIIVTFGVGDVDVISGEEAFLMQLERTNVAVSRAMAKCIVIMPQSLADYIPEDRRTLETAFAVKDYIEEFCNQKVPTSFISGSDRRNAQIRFHA